MAALRKQSAPAVKLTPETHARLQKLSKQEARPMGEIVTALVADYERQKFWQEVNASVERLRADPAAWRDYKEEVALLEGGSMDGLEQEPPYFTPEEDAEIRAESRRTYG
jgi:hypothetical protein